MQDQGADEEGQQGRAEIGLDEDQEDRGAEAAMAGRKTMGR